MRPLLIGALAANLAGCTCLPYSNPNAAEMDAKSVAFKVDTQNANSTIPANPRTPKSVGRRAKYNIARKMEPLPPAQLNNKADPILGKVKASIAAMMDDPASAEFSELKRGVKNLLNDPVDTVCGYVRGKNASGGEIGEMPFLYIIRDDGEDEAYLVNGRSVVAQTVHSVLCN